MGAAGSETRGEAVPQEREAGPIVVLNWTVAELGLVAALAAAAPREGGPAVVCVGSRSADAVKAAATKGLPATMRYVQAPRASDDVVGLARILGDDVDVARARSVIVRPDLDTQEADANSRVTCVAVARACESRPIPNVLVEVQDPDAAYEFAGLGVATVFYPGYLRAALLAHACVDLGVFQFVYGLLRGTYRVRLLPLPEDLRAATFLDAALRYEEDEDGRPITLVGLQLARTVDDADRAASPTGSRLLINPGPKHPLSDALGLLALAPR